MITRHFALLAYTPTTIMGKTSKTRSSSLSDLTSDEFVLALIEALSDPTVLLKIKKIGELDADELSNKISAQIGHHFKTLQ